LSLGDLVSSDAQLVVLRALGAQPELSELFVLKGAHATSALSRLRRPTLDIDLAVAPVATRTIAFDREGEATLREIFEKNLRAYCLRAEKDWRLVAAGVKKRPRDQRHPFGWDGFEVRITLAYRRIDHSHVDLDLSFDDIVGSLVHLEIGSEPKLAQHPDETSLRSYSREQIVAEKLRAFLQRLGPYRRKVGTDKEAPLPRVRDLHDITDLYRSASPELDLDGVAEMFRLKCAAKAVDCTGPNDFMPEPDSVARYRQAYESDPTLAAIPFDQAWETTLAVVVAITVDRRPPGRFPLPPLVSP
jgi:Nucleotidyl transferase AbiEii toxin, Type IV TA system